MYLFLYLPTFKYDKTIINSHRCLVWLKIIIPGWWRSSCKGKWSFQIYGSKKLRYIDKNNNTNILFQNDTVLSQRIQICKSVITISIITTKISRVYLLGHTKSLPMPIIKYRLFRSRIKYLAHIFSTSASYK